MRLREALEKKSLSKNEFIVFMHGETRIVTADGTITTTPKIKIL